MMEGRMRIGNTELIRFFLIVSLSCMILIGWMNTVGGNIAGVGGTAIGDKPPFNLIAIALLSGFPLLIFVLAAAVFRHYGRVSLFATRTNARALLGGAMTVSIVAAVIPLERMARWIG